MAPKRARSDDTSETALVIDLDNKKKVTVRLFNGIKLVDIREFYEDKKTGTTKPGVKGISINEQVWKKLLESQKEISDALAQLDLKRAKSDASESKANDKSDGTSKPVETTKPDEEADDEKNEGKDS